jgi:hypothetical protein
VAAVVTDEREMSSLLKESEKPCSTRFIFGIGTDVGFCLEVETRIHDARGRGEDVIGPISLLFISS